MEEAKAASSGGAVEGSYAEMRADILQLRADIAAEQKVKADYLKRMTEAERIARDAELRIEKMKQNAAIDSRAREGQLKRSRIIEHQLRSTVNDNVQQAARRERAERRADELQKALNRERAQRLADMHVTFKTVGNIALAERREKEMSEQYFAAEAECAARTLEARRLERQNAAHAEVHSLNTVQLDEADVDLERHKAEGLLLRTALLDTEAKLKAERRAHADLKAELARLRSELIRNATTHRDRATPYDPRLSKRPLLTNALSFSTDWRTPPPRGGYDTATPGTTAPLGTTNLAGRRTPNDTRSSEPGSSSLYGHHQTRARPRTTAITPSRDGSGHWFASPTPHKPLPKLGQTM